MSKCRHACDWRKCDVSALCYSVCTRVRAPLRKHRHSAWVRVRYRNLAQRRTASSRGRLWPSTSSAPKTRFARSQSPCPATATTPSQAQPLSHTATYTQSHSLTCSLIHTHSLLHTHSLVHTHSPAYTLTHPHTHTHPLAQPQVCDCAAGDRLWAPRH
jgi:hypothetical protein